MTNKEAIKLIQGIEEDGRNVNKEHIEALDLAIKALKERPHGKWIEMTDNHGHSSYFCSRCGTQEGKQYDTCPNCKAEMTVSN